MTTQSGIEQPAKSVPFDALSVVAIFWAGQTLVQLTSAPNSTAMPQTAGWDAMVNWVGGSTIAGWLAFAFAIATLLYPGKLTLFVALIAAATLHYICDWPFVSNHLILDTFISLTMLGAVIIVLKAGVFSANSASPSQREEIVGKFSPVVVAMFMLMYYFIVVSKMNESFFDSQISCMHAMYSAFLMKENILSVLGSIVSVDLLFWIFMILEWLLPIMLMIRKTRLLAIYIGVPFHFLLGLMGHYWYSSLVLTLYAIVALPAIMAAMPSIIDRIGEERWRTLTHILRAYVIALGAAFVATAILAPKEGLFGYRLVVLHWAAIAGLAGLLIIFSVGQAHFRQGAFSIAHTPRMLSPSPGGLWLIVLTMCLNSLSPYIGYKTTNSIAMYSNMRTENGENDHFFMPRFSLFEYQGDLVEVLDSSNPAIAKLKGWPVLYGDPDIRLPVYITYFELRRAVSRTKDAGLWVRFKRNGIERLYDRKLSQSPDSDLDSRYPIWLEKTAMFRPIFKDRAYCLH